MKQMKQLLTLLLVVLMVVSMFSTTAYADYYSVYRGSSGSIITALNSLGVNSSYFFREGVAVANSISNYSGTASQNTALLLLNLSKSLRAALSLFCILPVVAILLGLRSRA